MRVFCDTSVLIASVLQNHVHHKPAAAALTRIRKRDDIGHASAHALAETFSVLSRMPTEPKLQPADVLDILENDILPHFLLVTLEPEDYAPAIRDLVAKGQSGGRIYDLLHLRTAGKLALDRIYTFNESEWKSLSPELASLISTPPPITANPSGS